MALIKGCNKYGSAGPAIAPLEKPAASTPILVVNASRRFWPGGISRDDAETLIAKTHQVCPYSNATRNNIDVKLTIV
jgi:organic hydroperoxide reductase OsmC/OhrA